MAVTLREMMLVIKPAVEVKQRVVVLGEAVGWWTR